MNRFIKKLILICLLLAGTSGVDARAQDNTANIQQSRLQYLEAVGLENTYQEVQTALLNLLDREAVYLPRPRREHMSLFFAFVLTLHGQQAKDIETLHGAGIDVAHAFSADNRPLVEQALLTDLVVTGTVEGDTLLRAVDGTVFRDVRIRIKDVYRGITPAVVITIRQRNGREYGENPAVAAALDTGNTYLLLLSNGLFRYSQARRTTAATTSLRVPDEALDSYFSIYRQYEMDGDRVLWSGYSKRKTRKALEEVRRLDALLQ